MLNKRLYLLLFFVASLSVVAAQVADGGLWLRYLSGGS
jgi:hypothetical protein